MKLALGLILAMAAHAYADEDHSSDEDQAFLTAIQKHDSKALAAMVKTPFTIYGVTFKTAACQKQFGTTKDPKTVSDAKALVACLAQVKVGDGAYAKWGDAVMGSHCKVDAMIGGYDGSIQLDLSGGHPYKVISLQWKEMEGEAGGVMGGYRPLCEAPPPPPPPPPAPPSNIPPTLLEANRIAGNKAILPDAKTKADIIASGKAKVIGSFKLCLATSGEVSQVTMLKSTGFPAYDATLITTIRGEWKYKPYTVNGKAAPVCTAVTFIYGT